MLKTIGIRILKFFVNADNKMVNGQLKEGKPISSSSDTTLSLIEVVIKRTVRDETAPPCEKSVSYLFVFKTQF